MKKVQQKQDKLTKKQIRPTILSMNVNDLESFAIEKLESVKVTASNVSVISGRKFRTKTNKTEGVITVTRTA